MKILINNIFKLEINKSGIFGIARIWFGIFPVFLLILFLSLDLSAQDYGNITGFVFDENNGNPLVGANIYLNKTAIQTATTEDGNFVLENISAGTYEITISFLGYRNKNIKNIRVHEGFTSKLNVAMIPFPIPGDSVFVYGGDIPKSEIPLENKVILSSQDIKKFEKFGLPHLLQQVAGVQVESQGGSGGVSYLSIHGSKPREVLVLLDGQRLNNPQTGEVDLNSIPLSEIERIEIVRQGNAAAYGAGAFAGTIAFYTRDRVASGYARINTRFGSFQTSSGNISFGSKMKSMAVLGNYYQDYSLQNFEYYYEGKQILRENNWYRNQRIFGKVKLDLTRHQFSVMYNMRTGNRGLTSTYFDEFPSFNAKLNEKLTALQLQYRLLFSHKVYLETQIAQNQLQQSYRNLDAPIKQQYHNRQTNDVLESNIRLNVEQNNRLGYQLKLSYLKESLDQQNLLYPEGSIGEKSRESFAGFANIDYSLPSIFAVFKATHLRSSIGYQKIFNDFSGWYPFLGLNTQIAGIKSLSIGMNWGKAVRYPDFNSLFWKGDTRAHGNPNLKPERKVSWNYNLIFHHTGLYFPRISIFYFTEKINDLIFWHRNFSGEWEPRNEELVQKNGLDLQVEQNLIKEFLKFQTSYSWVNAINKKDDPVLYNKNIVFIPEHTFSALLVTDYRNWQAQINFRYVSQRETVSANSKGTQISPYQIWDAMIGYQIPLRNLDLEIGFIAKNIFDEEYQLIFGYPMPGVEYQLTMAIGINP